MIRFGVKFTLIRTIQWCCRTRAEDRRPRGVLIPIRGDVEGPEVAGAFSGIYHVVAAQGLRGRRDGVQGPKARLTAAGRSPCGAPGGMLCPDCQHGRLDCVPRFDCRWVPQPLVARERNYPELAAQCSGWLGAGSQSVCYGLGLVVSVAHLFDGCR